MPTTFQSQIRPPAPSSHQRLQQSQQHQDVSLQNSHGLSSRIPAKITTNTTPTSIATKPAQHVSQLARRTSRSITPTEKTGNGIIAPQRSMTADPSRSIPGRRASVISPASGGSKSSVPLRSTARGDVAPPMRKPSTRAGTTVLAYDAPKHSTLRRKPSIIEDYEASRRAATTATAKSETTPSGATSIHGASVINGVIPSMLGITFPGPTSSSPDASRVPVEPKVRFPPDMPKDQYKTTMTSPFLAYAPSTTPTTRYTDSPFSHVPTPSSVSSYSSAPAATSMTAAQTRSPSPARNKAAVNSRSAARADLARLGMPPVRESSTSSSGSTIKPSGSSTVASKQTQARSASESSETPQDVRSRSASKPSDPKRPTSRGKLVKNPPKQKTSNAAKPPVIPPELAHLNVDTPSQPKLLPPARPSRDGTSALEGMSTTSPVVQSDLPRLYTTYHKRTPSQETKATASTSSPSMKSRFGFASKSPSKLGSPRVDSAISPPPSTQIFSPVPPPSVVQREAPRLTRKDSPAIGPSPSPAKTPRFGFFHRKPKEESKKVTEKPKRAPTKGPAAGTGHEGYGRFNARGNPGSLASSSSSSFGLRSPSTDSNSSSRSLATNGRRNSSIGSRTSRKSRDSSFEMDEFLRERLTPIVLRGSGSTESNRTGSGRPIGGVTESSKTSLESYVELGAPFSAAAGKRSASPFKRTSLSGRRNVIDSSDDEFSEANSTLAGRRSLTRLSRGSSRSPVRLPAPIKTSFATIKTARDREGSDAATVMSSLASDPFEGREGLWLRPMQPKTTEPKPKPSNRWNFFQRVHAASPAREEWTQNTDEPEFATDLYRHQHSHQHVAYPMMDRVKPIGLEEVERIVFESNSPEDSMSESSGPARFTVPERRQTKLLPAPPSYLDYSSDSDFHSRPRPSNTMVRLDSSESPELMRAQTAVPSKPPHVVNIQRSPSVAQTEFPSPRKSSAEISRPQPVQTPEINDAALLHVEDSNDSPARFPRLSPVGRIPKVKSNRDRAIQPPSSSFSRPFGLSQPKPSVKAPGELYSSIRDVASPVDSNSQPVSSTSTKSDGLTEEPKSSVAPSNILSASTTRTSLDGYANQEFLFIPRVASDVSYSSSSGTYSLMAPMLAPLPQVEDVWNEYDDLLDEVMLPHTTPLSTGSSIGAPFQYSSMLYDRAGTSMPPPVSWAHAAPLPPSIDTSGFMQGQPTPEILSVQQQIARFMQPSMSPLITPQAAANPAWHYNNRSTSTLFSNGRSSIPIAVRGSTTATTQMAPYGDRTSVASSGTNSRGSTHSRSTSLPEVTLRNSHSSLVSNSRFRRDTQLLDIAEVDIDSQVSMANLRFGALMTSKFLSSGSVLLSPAHHEMRLSDEPRVLILDGMGSDWSYYVALSYPTASIYSLGPSPPNGKSTWPGVNQKPPANHQHIHHTSIDAAFPFPKGFFTAVVFRFPLATTDEAYHACLFECKRVLRPGGYLEVAVLDLDLTNMGSRARQAIRGLKTRLQQHDPDVSLRNLSDSLVRLIGRRGFEDIRRCIVGIPAAGRIPRSTDVSPAVGNNNASSHTSSSVREPWSRQESIRTTEEDYEERNLNFADVLANIDDNMTFSSSSVPDSSGPRRTSAHDEVITKMAARVGRWWYSSCYEKSLLAAHDKSIWHDPGLLRECEKQRTSFRILICYAQKPMQGKRRTVSL